LEQQLCGKSNVAWFGIEIENANTLEFFEQTFDLIPVSVEQFGGFLSPISDYFRREIGRLVDVCLCKVENARWEDNCYFDDLFGIIEVDEDRNGEALNFDDRVLLESQIRVSFTDVRARRSRALIAVCRSDSQTAPSLPSPRNRIRELPRCFA
jgi:hypothetical protein